MDIETVVLLEQIFRNILRYTSYLLLAVILAKAL